MRFIFSIFIAKVLCVPRAPEFLIVKGGFGDPWKDSGEIQTKIITASAKFFKLQNNSNLKKKDVKMLANNLPIIFANKSATPVFSIS